MKYYATIGSTIGSTPLVQLNRIAAGLPARIFAKLEFFNPLGSVKDRIAAIALWKEGNIPYRPQGRDSKKNIRWQLQQPNCYYLIAEDKGTIVGAILGTHDGRKGWINRLIVTSAYRQKGIAKRNRRL